MVRKQLSCLVIVRQDESYRRWIVRGVIAVCQLPFALARKSVLRQRAKVGELGPDDRNAAADRIAGGEVRRFSHEQHFPAPRGNPRGDVRAVQIHVRRAPSRMRQEHGGHSVLSGNDGRRHGIRYGLPSIGLAVAWQLERYRFGRPGGSGLLNTSRLIWTYSFKFAGTSSSGKIAVTGHSGSQAPQSMHSSGWIKSCSGPS